MDRARMREKPNHKYYFEDEEFCLDRYLVQLRHEGKRERRRQRAIERANASGVKSSTESVTHVAVPEPVVEKLDVTPKTQDKPSVTPVVVPRSAPAAEKLAIAPKTQDKPSVAPLEMPRSAPAAEKLVVVPKTQNKPSLTPMVVSRSAPAAEKLAVAPKTQDKLSVTPVVVSRSAPATQKLAIAPNLSLTQDKPKAQDDVQDKMLKQRKSVFALFHEIVPKDEKSSTITVKKRAGDSAQFAGPGASATTHQAPNELARENIVRKQQPLCYGGNDAQQTAHRDNEEQSSSSSRAGGNPRWSTGPPRELDSRFKNHRNTEFQSSRWRKNDNFARDDWQSSEEVIVSYGPTRIPLYRPTIEIASITITHSKRK